MHNKYPEMLYCAGLEDFFTIGIQLFAKFFLENSFTSIKNFLSLNACPET